MRHHGTMSSKSAWLPFQCTGKHSCFTLKIQRSKSNVLCIIEEFASPLEGSLLLDNSKNKKCYHFFYQH